MPNNEVTLREQLERTKLLGEVFMNFVCENEMELSDKTLSDLHTTYHIAVAAVAPTEQPVHLRTTG